MLEIRLEILHPDGTRSTYASGYKERLAKFEVELRETCTSDGAWVVEPKGLLVAWHYREVPKEKREIVNRIAASIYRKHYYEFSMYQRGIGECAPCEAGQRAVIHPPHSFAMLFSWLGGDCPGSYAVDSAADEFAMEVLKGVAYFKVINEGHTAITKTSWANSRLQVRMQSRRCWSFERKLSGGSLSETILCF